MSAIHPSDYFNAMVNEVESIMVHSVDVRSCTAQEFVGMVISFIMNNNLDAMGKLDIFLRAVNVCVCGSATILSDGNLNVINEDENILAITTCLEECRNQMRLFLKKKLRESGAPDDVIKQVDELFWATREV